MLKLKTILIVGVALSLFAFAGCSEDKNGVVKSEDTPKGAATSGTSTPTGTAPTTGAPQQGPKPKAD